MVGLLRHLKPVLLFAYTWEGYDQTHMAALCSIHSSDEVSACSQLKKEISNMFCLQRQRQRQQTGCWFIYYCNESEKGKWHL